MTFGLTSTFPYNFQKLNVIVKLNFPYWVQWSSSTGTSKINFCGLLDPDFFPEEGTLSYSLTWAYFSFRPAFFLFMLHVPYELHTLGTAGTKSVSLFREDKTLSASLKAGGAILIYGTAEARCISSVMLQHWLGFRCQERYRYSSTLLGWVQLASCYLLDYSPRNSGADVHHSIEIQHAAKDMTSVYSNWPWVVKRERISEGK